MQRLFNKRFRRAAQATVATAGPRFSFNLCPVQGFFAEAKTWLIWSVTLLFALVQVLSQLTTGLMADGLSVSYHVGPAGLALLIASYYAIYAPMQAPAGLLVDRYGPRLLLSLGGVIFALGTVTFAVSHTLGVAIVGRMIMGFGVSFAFIGCINAGARRFSMSVVRSLVVALEIISVFSVIIGNMVLPHWLESTSWRMIMLYLGGAGLVLGVLTWFLLSNKPGPKCVVTQRGSAVLLRMGYKKAMLAICKRPALWINGFYCGVLFSLVTVLSGLFGIPYLQEAKHLSLAGASYVDALLLWGVVLGCVVIALVQKRIKNDARVMAWVAWVLAGLSVSLFFFPFMSIWAIEVSLILMGALCTVYVLSFKVCARLLSPSLSASSIGFTNMLMVAVAPVLQLVLGVIIWFLSLFLTGLVATQFAMLVFPVLLLVAGILIQRIPK